MSLVKTEKGRTALINRDGGLTHRERQILVMSDGKRTLQEMRQFFVADITDDLKRLFASSMLIDISQQAIRPGNMSATDSLRRNASGEFPIQTEYKNSTGFRALSAPISEPASSSAPIAAPVSATPTKSRRSMAAAKMYTVDILQRMRDMDSPTLAVAIQTSEDEADLALNLINAVRYIYLKSGGSFGQRVYSKLYETIPELYLPAMDFLAAELDIPQIES